MKNEIKTAIYTSLDQMKAENLAAIETLTDTVSLTAYTHLMRIRYHLDRSSADCPHGTPAHHHPTVR